MTTTNANAMNYQSNIRVQSERSIYYDLAVRADTPNRVRVKKGSAGSIDGSANETTSTSTSMTEASHRDVTNHHDDDGTPPSIESAMMRTRTNFGDYQYYVPPETKASPHRAPIGSPVSPPRDYSSHTSVDRRIPQRLKLPFLPTSQEREPPEGSTSPSPLDEKRLHFFDDAASGQIPFDQVWNQQEFALEDEKDSDDDDNILNEEGAVDWSKRSERPFDEECEGEEEPTSGRIGVSDSSAFSAFASTPASISAAVSPPLQPPQQETAIPIQLESPDDAYCLSDGDIPSDEDETKQRRLSAPEAVQLSLATASKRVTAEDVGAKKSAEDLGCVGSSKRTDNDDEMSADSLFDFEQKQQQSRMAALAGQPISPQGSRSPSRWRKNAPSSILFPSDDEETSLIGDNDDEDDGARGLRERAQEAFAARRRFSPQNQRGPSPRAASPRIPPSPLPQKIIAAVPKQISQNEALAVAPAPAPAPPPRVSFTSKDTVHHFLHEYDMYSKESESYVSAGTYEEKTLGSDVEEAIKDIFMINTLAACGESSPQKIRYHSDTRYERRDSDQTFNSDEDDHDGMPTGNSDEESPTKHISTSLYDTEDVEEKLKNVTSQKEESDVFMDAMMSMVEGGIGAMTAAFGFAANLAESAGSEAEETSRVSRNTRGRRSSGGSRSSGSSKSSRKESKRKSTPSRPNDTGASVFDSMTDYILGPEERSESSDEEPEYDAPKDEREFDAKRDFDAKRVPMAPPYQEGEEQEQEYDHGGPQSLEDDPRLLELAKQSALCMHEVLGVRYDESRGVDIGDVKFVVVVLSLPLGIIFQEDYSGCWITKIMPQGNADLSGMIEAGDQLAAINGRSSIGMKVDDICTAMSIAASISMEIELTLLRYVGPFQPIQSDGRGMLKVDDASIENAYPPLEIQAQAQAQAYDDEDDEDEDDEDDDDDDDIDEGRDKPRSTMSITQSVDSSKSSKKKGSVIGKPPKLGGLRKKFKWLGRGKKQQKAE